MARNCPHLEHAACCWAGDRLYGGSLLASSLGRLVAGLPRLTSLSLLNVDVSDALLRQLAEHCPRLAHLGLGRTEDNAFGCMVSDGGLQHLARSCTALASLALFRCYAAGDGALATFARHCPQLSHVVLHNCPQVRHWVQAACALVIDRSNSWLAHPSRRPACCLPSPDPAGTLATSQPTCPPLLPHASAQVTCSGLISLAEGAPQLASLDVLVADSGLASSCLNFESCFALAANCSGLKVSMQAGVHVTGERQLRAESGSSSM